MTKRLTITLPDEVYDGLRQRIGPRNISRFLSELARPHVSPLPPRGSPARAAFEAALDPIEAAQDEGREREALDLPPPGSPEREALYDRLEQQYTEAALDEDAEREALEWIESGVDECLEDEDFSGWPGYPSR